MKKFAAFIFAALFAAGAFAEYEKVNGVRFEYSVAEGKATIESGYIYFAAIPQSTSGALVIPSTLGGYPVTKIGEDAFRDCKSLTSITIPNSVTEIGVCAFYGCSSLTSITIPNSVTEIGLGMFSGCSSLTSITIPDSVTTIGACAFYDCSSLTSITIPKGVTKIGEDEFGGCKSLHEVIVDSREDLPRIKELMKNSNTGISVEDLVFAVKTNKVSPMPTLRKKVCTECGATLDGKFKFCPECGMRHK